jgi:hypothetical protein
VGPRGSSLMEKTEGENLVTMALSIMATLKTNQFLDDNGRSANHCFRRKIKTLINSKPTIIQIGEVLARAVIPKPFKGKYFANPHQVRA